MSGPAKKPAAMGTGHCTCGYQATDADDLGDHLLEVFTPADDRDAKGIAHAEAADRTPTLTCLCGFAASDLPELDAHLLAVFTPADAIAPDGLRHVSMPPPADGV